MTTSGTGGYPPAPIDGPPASSDNPPVLVEGSSSASGQPPQIGSAAKEQGKHVASTAADQVGNVASESATQARDLLHEAQAQVRDQAGTQKDRAAGGLRTLGDELRSMSDRTAEGSQQGLASDLARQAATKVHDLAAWLDAREPGDILEEVRDLARRKPGTFLLGAAVAGLVAGRLTRGAVDAKRDDNAADGVELRSSVPAATPPVPMTDQAPAATAVGPEATVLDPAMSAQPDPLVVDSPHSYAGGERR
jgi:hypothetical protein